MKTQRSLSVLLAQRGGLLGASLAISMWVGLSVVTAQPLHKWVDEKGVTHYGDQLPTSMTDKPSQQLDAQGRVRAKTDAALTAEQRKAQADQAARDAELKKARDEQQRKDRILISMYANVSDIDAARERQLAIINAQIKSSQSRNQSLKQRAVDLQNAQPKGRNDGEIATVQREMSQNDAIITRMQGEIPVVDARFDAERKRFVEVKQALAQGKDAADVSAKGSVELKPTKK